MSEELKNSEKNQKIYRPSKLFGVLIFVLVVAVCVQGYYISRLTDIVSRQNEAVAGVIEGSVSPKEMMAHADAISKSLSAASQPATTAVIKPPTFNVQPNMKNNMNSSVNKLFNDPFFSGSQPVFGNMHSNPFSDSSMKIDQKPNGYIVKFILPGMDKKDISITLRNDILTVTGIHKKESKDSNVTQDSFNQFTQVLSVPADVDSSKITSSYKNGILTVDLPKTENTASKKDLQIN